MHKEKDYVNGVNNSTATHTNDSRKESTNQTMSFKFSPSSSEIRSLFINDEPWFVAKDVCDILGMTNSRKALSSLDLDEKGVTKGYTLGGTQSLSVINESGLYALIIRSNKPEAKTFRKWITSEVLPSIRKNGYYKAKLTKEIDYIDMRTTPVYDRFINNMPVASIDYKDEIWVSVSDVNLAMGNRTSALQTVKRLNINPGICIKLLTFGSTRPKWFTNKLGLQLMVSGSRIMTNHQLKLSL